MLRGGRRLLADTKQIILENHCSTTAKAMGRARGLKGNNGPKKPPLTHFLCLPLVTPASQPQFEQSLRDFTETLCPTRAAETSSCEDLSLPNIHPKSIRPVGALHFTLGVMSLREDQLAAAINFMNTIDIEALRIGTNGSCAQKFSTGAASSAPIRVDIKGLESMHAPHQTSVLYAAPMDKSNALYPFCVALQEAFKEKGFLVEDNRQLKLHATIVNTIYAKGRKGASRTSLDGKLVDGVHGHGPSANAPLKIDARPLLEIYQDHMWASNIVLDRVAICEMGAKKMLASDGSVIEEKYTEVATRDI